MRISFRLVDLIALTLLSKELKNFTGPEGTTLPGAAFLTARATAGAADQRIISHVQNAYAMKRLKEMLHHARGPLSSFRKATNMKLQHLPVFLCGLVLMIVPKVSAAGMEEDCAAEVDSRRG